MICVTSPSSSNTAVRVFTFIKWILIYFGLFDSDVFLPISHNIFLSKLLFFLERISFRHCIIQISEIVSSEGASAYNVHANEVNLTTLLVDASSFPTWLILSSRKPEENDDLVNLVCLFPSSARLILDIVLWIGNPLLFSFESKNNRNNHINNIDDHIIVICIRKFN